MVLHKNVNGKQVQCTEKEEAVIRAEWAENEQKAADTAWLRGRLSEYPSIGDQFDDLWHSMDKDEIPGKGIEWYDAIKAVKDKYPKPSK